MSTVYVLNKDGKPLMPTTRCGHVRHLLKKQKARVVASKPFTIQLLYETDDVVQPLYLGIDPGRTNIGVAVVKADGTAVFTAHLETRNREIPKLMKKRKESRRARRTNGRRCRRQRRAKANDTLSKKCVKQTTAQNSSVSKRAKEIGVIKRHLPGCEKEVLCIGIKNKEAKFNNRTRPEGWLTPTANQLLQTHINLVKKIQKFLPISDVVLEVNKFAFMQLDNPNIQKWQYQQGPLYQKANLEEAVSEMQEHHCLFCKKPIDHYHHVVPQHKNGSNTISNIVGLCTKHHDLVHKEAVWQEKLAKKKTGLNKKYGALSVLNQIIPALTKELSSLFPKHFFVTNGKSTYDYRAAHGVSKDHWLDAYCIACSVLPNDTCDKTINSRVPYELKQFRRHNRRALNNENMSRVYTFNGKMVAANRHKATEQTTDSLEEFRQRQPNDVCNLKVKEHHPTYRNMSRNYPGSIFLVEKQVHIMQGIAGSKDGKATTYKDTNANSIAAGKCKFVAKNSGILFVWRELKVVKPRKIFNNHEVTKMVRFYTPNLDEACDALNIYDIDYDLDDGDRIMVDDSFYDDVLDAFEEYDIEYEEL